MICCLTQTRRLTADQFHQLERILGPKTQSARYRYYHEPRALRGILTLATSTHPPTAVTIPPKSRPTRLVTARRLERAARGR